MYGIYLKCEQCGKTIGGEDVTPKQQGMPTLTRWQGRELRALAAQRGWTHQPPDGDLCPKCSKTPNAELSGARSGDARSSDANARPLE